jgi:heme oxygenase (mycobilin-producing)
MAITSILDLRLKPDSLDKANEIIHATLAATRAFDGCLGVTVLVDSADPAHVVLLEAWESAEHDQAYRVWRTTPEGASELGSILAAAPALTLYAEAEGV